MASSLEGNKFLAAILTAGIIASASGVFSRMLYGPHELEANAFKIELPEGTATAEGAAPAAEEKPFPVLLASASAAEGEKVAKKCASCHIFAEGDANKVGPGLYGVVDRDIGKNPGFSYSEAIGGHGGKWTYDNLNAFLTSPKAWAPGTKMTFAGLPSATDRANVIAYLRSLSKDPVPLPPT